MALKVTFMLYRTNTQNEEKKIESDNFPKEKFNI